MKKIPTKKMANIMDGIMDGIITNTTIGLTKVDEEEESTGWCETCNKTIPVSEECHIGGGITVCKTCRDKEEK